MNLKKYIPNTVTSMNLLCGVLGVTASFNGHLDYAFYMMMAAGLCDFCDGLLARVLGVVSDMGKELDSLSDLVSFGLLPAVMLHRLMITLGHVGILPYVPLAIVIFSALRLARFNVDDRQHHNFIGLATPACALLCGSLTYYICATPDSFLTGWAEGRIYIPVLSAVLALLLVSGIPMFSLKFRKGQKGTIISKLRWCFLGFCIADVLVVFLFNLNFSMIFVIAVFTYVIMNIVNWLATPKKYRGDMFSA